jgi:repressor LexA
MKKPKLARGYRLPSEPHWPINAAPQSLRRTPDRRHYSVPVLGRVQAGSLNYAAEDTEGYIDLPCPEGQQELFALRIRGDSMREAGILPGDVVIVRRQPRAESGDIVVALVEEEATLKTLKIGAGRVELHPQNPLYEPIVPDPEQLVILGKVIEVRRALESQLLGMK